MGDTARDLVDPFGRVVRDLRISVTDRCNFRCTYCMPEEGMKWLPRTEVLSFEEIERLARICVDRFGFDGIRLTGGEPTMRAHLTTLVSKLAALGVDIAMTTNGATLRNSAHDLRVAGLSRINISLDTLDAKKFASMTRRDELTNVLAGIDAAVSAGFAPVKINAVVERGVNDDEVVALAQFGRDRGVEVRFIEFMPLDASDDWQRNKVVGQDEIVELLSAHWQLEQVPARGAAPADRWRYLDADFTPGGGMVGVIPTVTKPFCGDCDRVRLTADGQFRTCLFATDEFDLRAALRGGETDDQIAQRIERAVGTKWAGHQINQVSFTRPSRSMSQIGG
ncbi:MAG TPA: GTP 3',8-cyclase MoaA [Ilumatobacter sp.]|nr:GTP 3',8-cyclase MoaA [Ilumatobacter sp.]